MRSLIFLILFLVGCSSTSSNFLDFSTPKKTQAETTVDDFKSRVGYLASDKLGGRSAGSKGDILARDYMVDLFEKSSSSSVSSLKYLIFSISITSPPFRWENFSFVLLSNAPLKKYTLVLSLSLRYL